MNSKAFPGQPNPAVFYESDVHRGAMRFLLSGVHEKEPFLLLLGKYGAGKTLLGFRLAQDLQANGYLVINVPTPVISYAKLLEQMLIKFEWTPRQQDEESLQNQLLHYLNIKGFGDQRIIVILDEIQDYDISTLVKIRMLSNYNIGGEYPFQFVLFGHPSFLRVLANQQLAALDQRIRRRYELEPFDFADTREYIYFRLINSGASGTPYFPDNAIRLIHDKSGGIPRVINNMCDACLLIGAAQGLDVIDEDVVREAVSFTQSELPPSHETRPDNTGSASREIAASERTASAPATSEKPESDSASERRQSDSGFERRKQTAVDFSNIQENRNRKEPKKRQATDQRTTGQESPPAFSSSMWLPGIIILLLLLTVGVLLGLVLANRLPDSSLQENRTSVKSKQNNIRKDEGNDRNSRTDTEQPDHQPDKQEHDSGTVNESGDGKADSAAGSDQHNEVRTTYRDSGKTESREEDDDTSLATLMEEMEKKKRNRQDGDDNAENEEMLYANQNLSNYPAIAMENTFSSMPSQELDSSAMQSDDKKSWLTTATYSLLIAQNQDYQEAIAVMERLRAKGIDDVLIRKAGEAKETAEWTIYQGFYNDREEAERARDKHSLPGAVIKRISVLRPGSLEANRIDSEQ